MNCRRVQKLIPLHVEGDLHTSAANRVESHLEWCGRCNWVADEYKESQSWLHALQPPAFDETVLDDLKRGVMKRVAESNARPSLFASLVQRWSRRQILALAASFVVVLGMVALYFYQAGAKSNPQAVYSVVEGPRSEELKPSRQPQKETATGEAPGASANKHHRALNRRNNLRSQTGHSVVAARAVARTVANQTVTTGTTNALTDQSSAQNGAANSSRDMLRIEIQTGDPSIRIIWFAPKETDLHQSKPATD